MRLPRVKKAHDPVRFPNRRIRIGSVQFGVGAEIEDDADGTVWRLLQLLDGNRTRDEIVVAMVAQRPEVDVAELQDLITVLLNSGHVEDVGAPVAQGLSAAELDRYSRNDNYFSWVDTTPRRMRYELQARLKSSRVAIVGLGGSGSAVAASLVAAGVGAVRCIDCDVIEESNLNRQTLYTEDDIGLRKVDRAVDRLRRMNRNVAVEGVDLRLRSTVDARTCLADVDFAVLCADTPYPDIQLWTNDAAIELGVAWSVCFYTGPTLMTGIFVPGQTPCYRCLLNTTLSPLRSPDGELGIPLYGGSDPNAVIAPTASLAGHLGALEATRYLTGLNPQTVGRLYHHNLVIYDHAYYVEPTVWAGCTTCASVGTASS